MYVLYGDQYQIEHISLCFSVIVLKAATQMFLTRSTERHLSTTSMSLTMNLMMMILFLQLVTAKHCTLLMVCN